MSSASADPLTGARAWPRASRGPRTSLAFRLGAWYAVSLLIGLALLGGLALFAVRRAVAHDQEVVVHERLERHREVLGRVGLPEFEREVKAAGQLEGEHGSVRVRNGEGRTIFRNGEVSDATGFVSTTVAGDLVLDVASTGDPWRRLGPPVTLAVAVVLLGCLALGGAGGARLTRRALRPAAALASTARAVIQSGDLSRRVDPLPGGSADLDQLAGLVNRMLDRNQTLVRTMREALDNVAHDLRTPLTRLRGVAEMALQGQDAGQAREALSECIEESDRALLMLRTLMDISEAEAGIMRLAVAPADLRAIAAEIVDLYEHVANEGGVALHLEAGGPVRANVDGNRVRQALANLVDNAIKYTPSGGRAEITTGADLSAREAWIKVRDTGYGIPAESLPRIWDRLYRVDPSRAARGLGLGLSLVKAIALAHGGHVSVESVPDQGSTFTLSFPFDGPTDRAGAGAHA